MIEKIKVYKDQNIVDMAIQEYGSIEGLVKLARRNGLTADGNPSTEELLQVDTGEVVNIGTKTFYRNLNYKVSTGIVEDGGTFDDTFDESFD
jgi:hypothetical protein